MICASLALLLAGCSVSPFGPSPRQQLAGLTVPVTPLGRSLRLVDGRHSEPGVQARLLQVAGGELAGERGAAGLLEVVVTGRGVHYQLLAVTEQRGRRVASSIYLGEWLSVEALRIEKGVVLLDLKRAQRGDPSCCPSLALTERYRWRDGRLQELSPPLLATRWELIELWGRPLQVADEIRPHLTLGPDRSAQTFGGCNELTVGYQLDGRTLRFDGVGGGAQYCSDTPEEDFIGALIQIDHFSQQGPILELHSGDEVLAKLRAAR
jgi:heat shock protein HslJ